MIALHCYRVYLTSKEQDRTNAFAAYEHLMNSPMPSQRQSRHPFYGIERNRRQRQLEQKLLHRTLHRPQPYNHRRNNKTIRTLYNFAHHSISYPFARRRNDGGRARTAFALYGLPFRSPQVPRPATISSSSSLVAKAFVH